MYHLENKQSGRHQYYNALTALIEDTPNLGVSISKLQKYEWDETNDFKYENDKYIVRFGSLIKISEVRLNEFFIGAKDAGLNPLLLPSKKAIEVNGIKVTYKRRFVIEGNKIETLTDALMYFF